jgi:hypothetical protein
VPQDDKFNALMKHWNCEKHRSYIFGIFPAFGRCCPSNETAKDKVKGKVSPVLNQTPQQL